MENLLLKFMQDTWAPELVIAYSEIFDLLYSQVPEKIEAFDMYFLSVPEDRTSGEISDDIHQMVKDILEQALNNMGFFVTEEAQPIEMFKIYEQLLLIDNNESTDFILSITEDLDEDASGVYYEILTFVGALQMDEGLWHGTIEKVIPEALQKLRQVVTVKAMGNEQAASPEYLKSVGFVKNKVKNFISLLNDDNFLVIQLLKAGMAPLLTFDSMLNLFKVDILALDSKEMLYNFYLFSLISAEGQEDAAGFAVKRLPDFVQDHSQLTQMSRALRDLQIKLSLHSESKGV